MPHNHEDTICWDWQLCYTICATSTVQDCTKLGGRLVQAIPSGSGRWDSGQQVIQPHVQGSSGRTLLAAALAKLGITSTPSGKVLKTSDFCKATSLCTNANTALCCIAV